jgi:Cu2+-containing amine oxidase
LHYIARLVLISEQITMEDLQIVESIVRKDPKVIEQCGLIGIPPEDMHKVYCDRKYQEAVLALPY